MNKSATTVIGDKPIKHINSITHEGKVIVFNTHIDGTITYTVKQDGFEDSYLNTPADLRTGWEALQVLEFPDEDTDQSVVEKETAELTHQENGTEFILRSLYKTSEASAVAPVQLISAFGHIYVFRQSKEVSPQEDDDQHIPANTLLVDRFVFDGMTNTMNRKLDVRFKRSKQKYTPIKSMGMGTNGLENIDSLDYRDMDDNFFYEPTTELSLINNMKNGWFSVVLVPTNENEIYRWHIFAYNSDNNSVELTTLRSTEEGLFAIKDYTVFDHMNNSLVPRSIPGVIKRSLVIKKNEGGIQTIISNGFAATKYDLQQEQQTQSGETQLIKTATRLLLAIPTNEGTAALSFSIDGNGLLSQIEERPKSSEVLRSQQREILLPLDTLDEIKAFADSTPPPKGIITNLSVGKKEEGIEDLVKISTKDGEAKELSNRDLVNITGNKDFQGLYKTEKIDVDTFDIEIPNQKHLGEWEKKVSAPSGLVFDGMISSYKIIEDEKLRVTCKGHGLMAGDMVQILGTESYNNTYPIQRLDDNSFAIERKWPIAEAVDVIKMVSQKRRGLVFDGKDDYIKLSQTLPIFSSSFTISMWVKLAENHKHAILLGDYAFTDAIDFNFEVKEDKTLRLF